MSKEQDLAKKMKTEFKKMSKNEVVALLMQTMVALAEAVSALEKEVEAKKVGPDPVN
jgi:hypothetical protein